MLYDKLQQLGSPHIVGLDQADKEQVFKCIRDRTGRFLTQDGFVLYIETEEEIEKPRYSLTGKAKEVLKDYYDAVHMLCEAQTNSAKSTQVLEEKIEDKCFLKHYPTGTATGSTNTGQNSGRSGTAGRQDVPRTDTITSLAKLQRSTPTQQNKPERWQHTCTLFCMNTSPA